MSERKKGLVGQDLVSVRDPKNLPILGLCKILLQIRNESISMEQVACSNQQAVIRSVNNQKSECEQVTKTPMIWLSLQMVGSYTTHEENRSHSLFQQSRIKGQPVVMMGLPRRGPKLGTPKRPEARASLAPEPLSPSCPCAAWSVRDRC